jgi:hypothetical protein
MRPPLDPTENLSPPVQTREHSALPQQAEEADDLAASESRRQEQEWEKRPSSRLTGDWIVAGILLLGLALNVAVLMTSAALTRADFLLGAAVFVVGVALLVLMVLCRKTGGRSL